MKGFQYKCVWADPNQEPTWEPESNIKPTADKLLNVYWRQATKSCKIEQTASHVVAVVKCSTPLKQSLLSATKHVVLQPPIEIAAAVIVEKPYCALTVMQITQKPINCSTPDSSPEKSSPISKKKRT